MDTPVPALSVGRGAGRAATRTKLLGVMAPSGPGSATIDLGDLSLSNGLVDRARAVAPQSRSGGAWTRRRQRLLAALLVPLCLAVLVAASVADQQLGAPLWTAQVSLVGFSLGADSVYISEPGARSMAALEAGTGRVRWRLALDEPLVEAVDLGGGDVAVITRTPGPNDETGRQNTITSVDPTGQVLAIHHGALLGPLEPGGLALIVMSTSWPVCADEPDACVDLVAFDPRSGRTVWRIGPLRWGQWFTDVDRDGHITTIATTGPAGAVMLRDPFTGAIATTISMPGLLDHGAPRVFAGTLVAVNQSAGRVELTGRRLDSPKDGWRLTLEVPGPVGEYNRFFYLDSCGDLLCVHIGRLTSVVDPRRGTVRFEAPYDVVARLGGGQFLAVPLRDPVSSGPFDHTVYVLDASDGTVRNTLTDAFGLPWAGGGGRVLLQRQGRFTEVVLLDADGAVSHLGDIEGTELNCLARGVVLACSDAGGRLRAWRLPG